MSEVVASVLLSGLVSWGVAYLVAGRSEHGRRAADARRTIREVVRPLLMRVQDYRSGYAQHIRRQNGVELLADARMVEAVMTAARELPGWRMWFVRRRLSRLVGPATLQYVTTLRDSEEPQQTNEMLAFLLNSNVQGRYQDHEYAGLIHHALKQDHTVDDLRRLERQLSRLSRSW